MRAVSPPRSAAVLLPVSRRGLRPGPRSGPGWLHHTATLNPSSPGSCWLCGRGNCARIRLDPNPSGAACVVWTDSRQSDQWPGSHSAGSNACRQAIVRRQCASIFMTEIGAEGSVKGAMLGPRDSLGVLRGHQILRGTAYTRGRCCEVDRPFSSCTLYLLFDLC